MKTIRLGNDIVVRWRILRNGNADDLSTLGKSIAIILSCIGEEKRITDYILEGNVAIFKLLGKDLQNPGVYRLTYIENEGLPDMYSVDCNRAFRISGAGQATGGDDTVNITTETIALSSEVTAPADGLSAYEVAVANGYVGSVEDWLQSLKGDKMTYADLTDSDKQDLYAGGASIITPLIDTKQDVITDLDLIRNGAYKGDTALQPISLITYSDLVSLRDANRLIPGMQYRITDYDFTTTEDDTDSAHLPFDIIVTADSESVLNESARAIHHQYAEGEEDPLSSRNIAAWEIKYTLKNIKHSSSDGKGTILWMKDEFRNECYYDFINALFRVYEITKCIKDSSLVGTFAIKGNPSITYGTNNKWVSTFGSSNRGNIIRYDGLAKIVFGKFCSHNILGDGCSANTFGDNCAHNIVGSGCTDNIFGNSYYRNILQNGSTYNIFGSSCCYNIFGNRFGSNTLGKDCLYNIFGNFCSSIIFGDRCSANTFGNECHNIIFASDKSASTKHNYYINNHFGDGCGYIVLTGAGMASDTSPVQNYHFAQGVYSTSSDYLTIDGVRGRDYETKVAKNSAGVIKVYCEADLIQ